MVDASRLQQVRVVGYLREQPLEVGALVEVVELGGYHNRVDCRRDLGVPYRVVEEEGFPFVHEGFDAALLH